MAIYTISMPQPCTENWDSMKPEVGGNHCNSCNKFIKDFSGMKDEDIIQYILENKTTCGRFSSNQLNKPILYIAPFSHKKYHWPSIAAFIIAGMFSVAPAFSQTTPQKIYDKSIAIPKYPETKQETTPVVRSVEIITTDTIDSVITQKSSRIIEIKGKVVEEGTHEPVPFCNIVIRENGKLITGQAADIDGKFWIKLDDGITLENLELTASSAGLPNVVKKLDMDPVLLKDMTIEMKNEVHFIGVITINPKVRMEPTKTTDDNHYTRSDIMNFPGQ